MASATTEYVTTLNGLFKMVYANELTNLIPDGVKALKLYKFSETDRIGNKFNFPVKVSHPQSATYASAAAGAFALNNIAAGLTQNAEVDGYQILFRDAMDYETAAKASEGGKRAFVKATRYMVESMIEQMSKRLEIQTFYGQTGLGKVSSTTAGTLTGDMTLTAATWAPLMWAGMEGCPIAIYNGASAVAGTSTTALTISKVDIDNKVIYMTGDTTEIAAISAGYDVYFYGAKGNEFAGIDKLVTNTGTIFGISAASYNLWKGGSYGAGSADLSLKKIEAACAVAAGRGGLDGDAVCWVSFKTWANLVSDLAGFRMFDSSFGKEGVNGFESIKFYAINGVVEVVPSGYVKEGEAFILPKVGINRVGATDMTFNIPGQANESDERFFFPIANYAGFELRLFSHQALVIKTPAKCVKITTIVNS